jgi:hypothetical protein
MPAAVASKEAWNLPRLCVRSQVRAAQIRERDFPWKEISASVLYGWISILIIIMNWLNAGQRDVG